tara:strand:+ start:460 stop:642 length:183 start_codon:yes stop_codon:yes gene_type:complete
VGNDVAVVDNVDDVVEEEDEEEETGADLEEEDVDGADGMNVSSSTQSGTSNHKCIVETSF